MALPDSGKPIPPPPAPKPKRPRKPKLTLDNVVMTAEEVAELERLRTARTVIVSRRGTATEEVQIPAETDPASAFRADMQLRKAIAERRLAALEAKRAAVDGDRTDRKALIDAEANSKKHRLDATADAQLAQIDDETASVIRTIAGIGAALDASQPPAIDGAAHTGVGGYIGLHRANFTNHPGIDAMHVVHENLSAEQMADIDRRQQERLRGTDQ